MARRKRKSRSSTRRIKTIRVTRKCKAFRIKCGKKLVQCHVGRKHRGGIYCRKVKSFKKKK